MENSNQGPLHQDQNAGDDVPDWQPGLSVSNRQIRKVPKRRAAWGAVEPLVDRETIWIGKMLDENVGLFGGVEAGRRERMMGKQTLRCLSWRRGGYWEGEKRIENHWSG